MANQRSRQCRGAPLSACAALVVLAAATAFGVPTEPGDALGDLPFVPVHVVSWDARRGRVDAARRAGQPRALGLVLFRDMQPLGYFIPVPEAEPTGRFMRADQPASAEPAISNDDPCTPDALRAWLIPSDVVARSRQRWPRDADLFATIDSVGPGARSAWLTVGRDAGVQRGDTWLRRVGGQPVARFEARLVAEGLSACGVTPLVSDLRLAAGDVVTAWPSTADPRDKLVRTAVTWSEETKGDQIIWLAAPTALGPRASRVELLRQGQYVGGAVVERDDERFWYARTLAAVCRAPIQIGDEARPRPTLAQAGRLTARVFDGSGPILIDAGEDDGLSAGDEGVLSRGGVELARVRVEKVQAGYAVVRCEDAEGSFACQRLDEVHFGPRPALERVIGHIDAVRGLAVGVALDVAPPATGTPLALVDGAGRTLGVALLLDPRDRRAAAVVLPQTTRTAPLPGMRLLAVSDAAAGPGL